MLISKTQINKIIIFPILFFIIFSIIIPLKSAQATVVITTEALQPDSVILKGTGLTPGDNVALVINAQGNTPAYNQSHQFTVNNQGWAFSSFTGLTPNSQYGGILVGRSGSLGTKNFVTPAFQGSNNVTLSKTLLKSTSVTLYAVGLLPNQEVKFYVSNGTENTPNYNQSKTITSSSQGTGSASFTGLSPTVEPHSGKYAGTVAENNLSVASIMFDTPPSSGLSSEKTITSFNFTGLTPVVIGTISNLAISLTVPTGTDVTKLKPTITLSSKATITPASLVVQNFTNPINYKVTAEDGTSQNYLATTTVSDGNGGVGEKNWYYLLYIKNIENGQHVGDFTETDCKTKRTEFINSDTFKNGRAVYIVEPSQCIQKDPEIITPTCIAPAILDTKTNTCVANTKTTYTMLAPLPGLGLDETSPTFDTTKPCAFGDYLNIMIKIFLGICGVLAVIMIVWGGVQYMTSELISSKEEGRKSITNAVFGLLLALGSYMILNTLNPDLLNICLKLDEQKISISADEKLLSTTEENIIKVGSSYELAGTFTSPSPSAGVSDFKNKLSGGGHLTGIVINTGSSRATFSGTDSSNKYISVSLPIKIGQNGVSDTSTAKEGDGKTPKGTYSITSDRRPSPTPPINEKAALNRDGTYNMGAAFINYGATINGKDRGMGFHGRFESGLGSVTNGCIRMSNDDLVALSPYMISGLKVVIE
ncbi:MAG: L,D-transpeptidase family protein [bacterium]